MATITPPTSYRSAFKGKSRVQQHQMVYDALGGRMGGVLHALALDHRRAAGMTPRQLPCPHFTAD